MSTTVPIRVDVHLSGVDLETALADDVRSGLTATPKELPPPEVLRAWTVERLIWRP